MAVPESGVNTREQDVGRAERLVNKTDMQASLWRFEATEASMITFNDP